MNWLLELHLLRLFDFYLLLAFLASTLLRVKQYRTILQVLRAVPGRWPRLFQLVRQHQSIFLTLGNILPLVLTLMLWLGHTLLRRLVLTEGEDLTVQMLLHLWLAVPFVAAAGLAMLCFDLYGSVDVAEINRAELEKYFDQAEYWLRSWTAPVVRVFTLGYINPRKIVAIEVQNALVSASQTINESLWWMTIQAVLRILFGVTLWGSFLLSA